MEFVDRSVDANHALVYVPQTLPNYEDFVTPSDESARGQPIPTEAY